MIEDNKEKEGIDKLIDYLDDIDFNNIKKYSLVFNSIFDVNIANQVEKNCPILKKIAEVII